MNKMAKELMKRNGSRENLISKENEEIYTNMIVYLRGSKLSDYSQEQAREDFIELILDGQQRGDNIQKVMGYKYKEICDEIIDAMPKKTKKEKIMEFAEITLNCLWILGVIALFKNLITDLVTGSFIFNFVLSAGDILSFIIIIAAAYAIVIYITKTAFNETNDNKLTSFLKTCLIITPFIVIIILSSLYFNTTVVNIPLWHAALIILLIFIVQKIISSRIQ